MAHPAQVGGEADDGYQRWVGGERGGWFYGDDKAQVGVMRVPGG